MADTIQFLTVEEEGIGTRCDRFLAGKLPDLSRSRIQELIAEDAVLIDGKPVKSSRKIRGGCRSNRRKNGQKQPQNDGRGDSRDPDP